jgi:hypothetical protein
MNFKSFLLMLQLSCCIIPAIAQKDTLPAPNATKSSKNYSRVIGWPEAKMPQAPAGFTVTKYADGFKTPAGCMLHPMVIYWWQKATLILN